MMTINGTKMPGNLRLLARKSRYDDIEVVIQLAVVSLIATDMQVWEPDETEAEYRRQKATLWRATVGHASSTLSCNSESLESPSG